MKTGDTGSFEFEGDTFTWEYDGRFTSVNLASGQRILNIHDKADVNKLTTKYAKDIRTNLAHVRKPVKESKPYRGKLTSGSVSTYPDDHWYTR